MNQVNHVPSAVCSPSHALQVWDSLPEKSRASVAGSAFKQIIGLLAPNGYAELSDVASQLFPNETLDAARKILSTQIANRAYITESGQQPLRLCISRKSKLNTVQQVWFEAAHSLPSDAPLNTPRYEAANFAGGLAQALTGQEIVKELNDETKKALSAARSSPDKTDLNSGRDSPIHGLGTGTTRKQVAEKDFVSTHAQLAAGIENLGKTVTCLNAMLHWACDPAPKAPRLLALLGDYGTGKTSHAMQLDRVLNGLVPFPFHDSSDMPTPERMPKPALIDLSLLAGVPNMAYLSLVEILTVALNKRRSGAVIDAASLIAQAKAGEVVMLYDGLDELLKHNEGHALHNLLDQLLRVLESDPVTQKPSKAKIMVSCRTHYFRDLQSQHAFFDTRRRGVAQANDYLCLSLLPWNALSIKEYLGKRLNAADASAVLEIIETTYNLNELASKPVLLSMMCEQVGQLLREKESAQPVTASRLYSITVAECLGRDNGKHTIKPHHKPLLMGALATAMWNEGVEQWSADKLDGWLARTVPLMFPNQYANVNMGALQDDLRTATFIVRHSGRGDRFNFSHRSFMEYFIARWVWDCTNSQHDGLIDEAVIRQYLPRRELNVEATNFAREIWQSMYNHSDTKNIALRQSVYVWRWLQCADVSDVSVEIHTTLFKLILALGLAKKGITQTVIETYRKYLIKNQTINLQNLELIQERWEDLDFSPLPGIDFRNANLLCLRAWRCNFGVMQCDGGNWAQTVFRDCEMSGMDWGTADKGGMMIRFGERKPITKALKGPWTMPFDANEGKSDLVIKNELNVVLCVHEKKVTFLTHELKTGRPISSLININYENKSSETSVSKRFVWSTINNDYERYSLNLFLVNEKSKKIERILFDFGFNFIKNKKKKTISIHVSGQETSSYAVFNSYGNLLDYNDEAADTWLFCLASGRPEPLETALPVD